MSLSLTKIFDLIILFILAVLSVILFRLINIDLAIQQMFFHAETGWFLKEAPPWNWLYHYGNLAALILSVFSLVVFALSFNFAKFYPYRMISLFLVLVMLIGPGLLINSILKDNWGRPRPRNITEFGGKNSYEELLEIDPESKGKSFPCGHCSMGFYFMALYFVLRRKKRILSCLFLFGGIGYGLLIGMARIIQGGHFASDVIWSGILVYLTAAGVFYLLKLDRNIFPTKPFQLDPKRKLLNLIILILIIFLIIGVLTATPFEEEKDITSQLLNRKYDAIHYQLEIFQGDVEIELTNKFQINFSAHGFGFPQSDIDHDFTEFLRNDTLFIHYRQEKDGFFTELVAENQFQLLENEYVNIELKIENEGNVYLPSIMKENWSFEKEKSTIFTTKKAIRIYLKEGEVVFSESPERNEKLDE